MKTLLVTNKGLTWRVIFPTGAVIDFPNSEPSTLGGMLTIMRGCAVIAVFQSWAGYHVVEAP